MATPSELVDALHKAEEEAYISGDTVTEILVSLALDEVVDPAYKDNTILN
jgi:hypothetical protein